MESQIVPSTDPACEIKRYLHQRPGRNSWWFRRRVPGDLISVIGQTEWRYTLKSRNRDSATNEAIAHLAGTNNIIELARRGNWPPLSPEQADALAKEWRALCPTKKDELFDLPMFQDEASFLGSVDEFLAEHAPRVRRHTTAYECFAAHARTQCMVDGPNGFERAGLSLKWTSFWTEIAEARARRVEDSPGGKPIAWAYERWLRAADGDRAPGTVPTARRHWDAFLAHSMLATLGDVRRSHMLAWRDSLADATKPDGGKRYRPKSINQRLQLVTAILRAGWRDAEMPAPDFQALTLPEPDDSDRGSWTRNELLTVLRALEPQSWEAWIFLIGLTTGTRLGEPVAAQRSWWNSRTRFIEVPASATKKKKPHAMPVIECLLEPFKRYLAKRPDGYLFGAPLPKNPDVPISNVASKAILRTIRSAGVNRVFHELRDTWIEEARHSPVKKDLWEIISGHSPATVSDRYGGEKPEALAKANEHICRFATGDADMREAMMRLVA